MLKLNIIILSLLMQIIGSSGTGFANKTTTTTNTFIFDESEFQKLAHNVQHIKDVNKSARLKVELNAFSIKEVLAVIKSQCVKEIQDTVRGETFFLINSLKSEIADLKNSIMSNVTNEINNIQMQIKAEIGNFKKSLPASSEIDHLRKTIQPEINHTTNISKSSETVVTNHYPSCVEALQNGEDSGIYTLYLPSSGLDPFDVYCLQDPENGPAWTVFHRRQDGSVDFYKNWQEYKEGFGDLAGEFFIGLEKLYALTNQEKSQQLWIKLTDWEGETRSARYTRFKIGNEMSKYNMTELGDYSGDAGDALRYHRGQTFSTNDSDNDNEDGNCAMGYKGAWWFNKCYLSHLNGKYLPEESIQNKKEKGIVWSNWHGLKYSHKYVHMALRPSGHIDFNCIRNV